MSSFVAMLKDSFREAVDGWIFAVMLGLAGVLILLVASSSVAPLPADVAVPRMLEPDGPQIVKQDRGAGPKQAFFLFRPEVANAVATTPGAKPWEGGAAFTLTFRPSGGFGAAGVEVELGEDRRPKAGTDVQQAIILGDPFQEAVRYWAARPGEKKPAYSEELAREFVAAYVAEATGLTGLTVARAPDPPPDKKDKDKKEKKGGGGLLGGLLGGTPQGPPAFAVTASGGDRLRWAHQPSFLFGAWSPEFKRAPLGRLVYQLENTLLNGVGAWVLLLAGVIVTAGFIPNMLRKGAIDLLLTKPVSRPLILFYKYLGGLLFVFLLTAVTVGGVWLAVGARTGVWAPGLLWCIGGITFYFAILYACSTLVGVLTRNAIVSIVLTITFWFLVWLIGTVYGLLNVWDTINTLGQAANRGNRAARVEKADKGDKGEKGEAKAEPAPAEGEEAQQGGEAKAEPQIPTWLVNTFKYANKVTPRTGDLDDLTSRLVARDLLSPAELKTVGAFQKDPDWVEVLAVAVGWIVFLLGLATVRFVTRSY